MDLPVDKFIEGLLTEDALNQPSDIVKLEELDLQLPPWYDKEKYNRGREFFWRHCNSVSTGMSLGLLAVFAIPSILKVLVSSQRSTTVYTAYKRYVSTHLHSVSWYEHELEPGSVSWKSLYEIRKRHLKAGLSAKVKFNGTVSQRDIALTQFGFFGFVMLKPDKFGVMAMKEDDWDCFNHLWRTIGYMIGLEDRYNICRKTVTETREVLQILLDRVYTPCLANVPEYFEHMSAVMIDGLSCLKPSLDVQSLLYFTKYIANVPGFVYTDNERIELQKKMRKALGGKPESSGIDIKSLMPEPLISGLSQEPKLLYLNDYNILDTVPEYKKMTKTSQGKLSELIYILPLVAINWRRRIFNMYFYRGLFLIKYFPYIGFLRFGIKSAYVDMFAESPKDVNATPKPNSYYFNRKPLSWLKSWINFFWNNN